LQRSNSPYWNAVRLKHKLHHKSLTKDGAEHFGLLWVPLDWIRAQKKKA